MSSFELSKLIHKLSINHGKLIGAWSPVMFTVKSLKIKSEDGLDVWMNEKYKFMVILWENKLELIRIDGEDNPIDISLIYEVEEKRDSDERIFESDSIRLRICGYNYHAIEFLYEYDFGDKSFYQWEILAIF